MDSTGQLQLHLLSKKQQRLLSEMSVLYEQSECSSIYFQDVLKSSTNISQPTLAMHIASMAFNINILTGKTTKLIKSTILLSDPSGKFILYYCYGLADRPWEFVVHATFYNLPLALIDTRKWKIYKDESISGLNINYNIIALKLKSIALNSAYLNRKDRKDLFDKVSIKASSVLLKIYLYVNLLNLFFKRKFSQAIDLHALPCPRSLFKYLTLARPLLNLTPRIDAIQNAHPGKSSNRIGLLTKDIDCFGHHIWNDALGIVTASEYIQMPKNLVLVEGPHNFTASTQMLKTTVPTCKLSFEDMRGDFWCSFPLLALRAYPVMRSAASQLAFKLTNSTAPSSSIQVPTEKISPMDSFVLNKTDGKICVVYSLRLGGRPWLNSLETIVAISRYLVGLTPNVSFLIDGMTNFPGMKSSHFETMQSEIALSLEIQRSLVANGYHCHVITGLDLLAKMYYYKLAGLFIQTCGSGDVIPHMILRKPVIGFGPLMLINCTEDLRNYTSGNMPPFIGIRVNNQDGEVVLRVNDLQTKEGYSVDPGQIIKSIEENRELMELFVR
jgi:hypothetical protein